jgi:hypothetical protein
MRLRTRSRRRQRGRRLGSRPWKDSGLNQRSIHQKTSCGKTQRIEVGRMCAACCFVTGERFGPIFALHRLAVNRSFAVLQARCVPRWRCVDG